MKRSRMAMSALVIATVVLLVGKASMPVRAGTQEQKTQAKPGEVPANKTSSPNQGTALPTVTGNPADRPGTSGGGGTSQNQGGAAPPAHGAGGTSGTTPAGQTPEGGQQTPLGNTGTVPKPAEPPATIFMPDGQLKSHLLQVYVTRDIQESLKPELQLFHSHAITSKGKDEMAWRPAVSASASQWHETYKGQDVPKTGTLLLFDLSDDEIDYKATNRVTPRVRWVGCGGYCYSVSEKEVNVGDILAATGWTILIVAVALALVLLLARKKQGGPIGFLRGVDGHLSLGQTQMACWTIAVGGVALGYGLIRLEIPTIPGSLVALMGASLVTGGVASFQDGQNLKAAQTAAAAGAGGGGGAGGPGGGAPVPPAAPVPAAPAAPAPQLTNQDWSWSDLVRTFTGSQSGALSLAKAQMIFWTVLLLFLFVSKSILDGVIWDIPWALVALMGFSQAGYLAPKLTPQ